MDYSNYFTSSIDQLRDEGRYRKFVNISRIAGEFPYAIHNETGKRVILWCSNDYLGMGQDEVAIARAVSSMKKHGLGSGGTRNISGTSKQIVELEEWVAKIYEREAALTFVSGYVANDASLQALAKIIPDLVIFSDQNNHASIICGIRNSKAKKEIFKHNDMDDLEEKLKNYPKDQPKLIVFESVYSMDGDFGEVEKIIDLAKKYGALTFCDEVHAVGLYGEKGGGYCQEIKMDDKIDIIQGTFAKTYGTIGGFITGKKEIVDAIRLNSHGFIFSTSLPPMIAAATMENIRYLSMNHKGRDIMMERVKQVKDLLEKENIDFVKNQSHIISVKIGDAKKAEDISSRLLSEFGIYVQHINYPTVARGDERLRIIATPFHSGLMAEDLVKALKAVIV